MIVYDFSSQSVVSYNALGIALIFALFGLYAYLFSIYKPPSSAGSGKYAFALSFRLHDDQFHSEDKPFGRAVSIFFLIVALLLAGNELRSYIYVKNINWFKEIK